MEILDHIASDIERKMLQGTDFREAMDESLQAFGEDNFLHIILNEQHISKQKNIRIMKRISIIGLLLFSTIIFLIPKQSDTQEMPVFSQKEIIPKAKLVNQEPPEISPIQGKHPIVSTFGKRRKSAIAKTTKFHKGIDIKAPIGTGVVATSAGTVIKVKNNKDGYGKHIIIQHDEKYKTLYAHLSTTEVVVGQKINKGDKIGEVGNTGMSISPHLHYEVIKDGAAVNPEEYIRS